MSSGAHIKMARDHARKVLDEMGITEPPVLLRDVINHLKNVRGYSELAVYPVDYFTERVSGIIVLDGDVPTIGYNQKQHEHRQRFSVAHEIGHLMIGHACTNRDDYLSDQNPHEVEANQFAAELLMPQKVLKIDFRCGVTSFEELARKYWVSTTAIGWKAYATPGLLTGRF